MPKVETIHSGGGRSGARRARHARVSTSLAEINVVPLVDVMLVLLVIFMVAAPMMTQGFKVELPESRRAPAVDQDPVTVSVPTTYRRDGRVRLGQESIPLSVLGERITQALAGRSKQNVILAADGSVQFQDVMTVMDELKGAGVDNVSMQTQPPRTRRTP